jgi:hypothetical protein
MKLPIRSINPAPDGMAALRRRSRIDVDWLSQAVGKRVYERALANWRRARKRLRQASGKERWNHLNRFSGAHGWRYSRDIGRFQTRGFLDAAPLMILPIHVPGSGGLLAGLVGFENPQH